MMSANTGFLKPILISLLFSGHCDAGIAESSRSCHVPSRAQIAWNVNPRVVYRDVFLAAVRVPFDRSWVRFAALLAYVSFKIEMASKC